MGKGTEGTEAQYPGKGEVETGATLEGAPDEAGAEKGSGGVTESALVGVERDTLGRRWRCEQPQHHG